MMQVVIRRLVSAEDAGRFREMWIEAIRTTPLTFGQTLAEAEATTLEKCVETLEKNRVFGAFDADGRLVGLTSLERKKGAFAHIGKVSSVFVVPEYRGKKVAEQLMQAVEAEARAMGVCQLTLAVSVLQDRTKTFYDKLGFVVYGVEPAAMYLDGVYVDEELRVKVL